MRRCSGRISMFGLASNSVSSPVVIFPALRLEQSCDAIEQCRFAGSGRAENDRGASREIQRDIQHELGASPLRALEMHVDAECGLRHFAGHGDQMRRSDRDGDSRRRRSKHDEREDQQAERDLIRSTRSPSIARDRRFRWRRCALRLQDCRRPSGRRRIRRVCARNSGRSRRSRREPKAAESRGEMYACGRRREPKMRREVCDRRFQTMRREVGRRTASCRARTR